MQSRKLGTSGYLSFYALMCRTIDCEKTPIRKLSACFVFFCFLFGSLFDFGSAVWMTPEAARERWVGAFSTERCLFLGWPLVRRPAGEKLETGGIFLLVMAPMTAHKLNLTYKYVWYW